MKKLVSFQQIMAMVKTHGIIAVLSFMMGFFLLLPLIASGIGNMIFTIIFTLIYVLGIYGTAAGCARQDKKPYTLFNPYPWKGLILPIGIWVFTAIFLLLYQVAWQYMTIDGSLATIWGIVCSIMFTAWTFMFNGFMGLKMGAIHGYGLIIVFVLPVVASGLGYYAGYRDLDIQEKLRNLIYERKK